MTITTQELVDAKADAQTFEEVVNESSSFNGNGTTTARKGAVIKTIRKVLEEMAEYNLKGGWVASTTYNIKDLVIESDIMYVCIVDHTSTGAFDTDYATSNYWAVWSRVVGQDGKTYKFVSCVLRQDSRNSGWYAIDDAGHSPVGIESISSNSNGQIIIDYNFPTEKIGSLNATVDEGYANGNLTLGCSVGGGSSILSLYHPFYVRTSGTGFASHSYFGDRYDASTNPDGEWSAVADVANGTYTFTHPSESHSDAAGSVIAVTSNGEVTAQDKVSEIARSKTGFTLEHRMQIHGETSSSSVLSDNISGGQSIIWDGTDTLTITHPTSPSNYGAQVTSENPRYHAASTAQTATTITVQFFDIQTGALYTGSSKPCDVAYTRVGDSASPLSGGTKVKAERLGKCKVRSQNVAGASSNIWVFGIFEI